MAFTSSFMKAPLLVSQSVKITFSQKQLIRVHIKFWFLKDKKVTQPEKKYLFWGKV